MIIARAKTFDELTDADLAAFYKFMGYDKFYAWDMYVINRGLNPTIDAKEFYGIFEYVSAAPMPETREEVEFTPTHIDTLTDHKCMIFLLPDGAYQIIWDTGYNGVNPAMYPPEPPRFLPLLPGM